MAKTQPDKSDKKRHLQSVKERVERSQERFIEAYKKQWIPAAACRAIGISRETYYEWCRKYPGFKKKVEMVDEEHLDYAEGKLAQQISMGNLTAITFFLKSRHPKYKREETTMVKTDINLVRARIDENRKRFADD